MAYPALERLRDIGMKIDFFIAGVQKGGTTPLFRYLRSHPEIAFPQAKELHFFDDESRDWRRPNYQDLHSLFDHGKGMIYGEATPIYIFWPNALERIREYNPDAKIVILLRHPTFRAHSHWRMQRARKVENLTFEEAIGEAGEVRYRECTTDVAARQFSYLQRSFYAKQIERLLSIFSAQQILFLRTDLFWRTPQQIFSQIEEFLGIGHSLTMQTNYITPFPSNDPRTINAFTRNSLDELFKPDILAAAQLAQIDLSDWLSPDYSEPMRPF